MTERLRPGDPARIGGHRLLGRLGTGGVGTVYLGRTDAGALAAVKVILPEYAGDEEFRTRFRHEAEAARRVDSPWAVRVTGADTESETPWLATEFVPGPTLPEVVARYGPLPARSVKVLGRLLARALAAVHAAGLAHRDVKPGNVLLAADGPRLIDFGIARAADATALTATGLVVGTPGFLPPEQATGSGADAGPAGDVFSLGALLAYAATGRPPFGSGRSGGRAVPYGPRGTGPRRRTARLAAPGQRLPDQDPGHPADGGGGPGPADGRGGGKPRRGWGSRGGHRRGRRGRGGGTPRHRWRGRRCGRRERRRRGAGKRGRGRRGRAGGKRRHGWADEKRGRGWRGRCRRPGPARGFGPGAHAPAPWALPGLPALIAERSAAALALPDPDPHVLLPDATPPDGDPPTSAPTRRRLLTAGAVGAVLLAGGSAAVWSTARRRTGPSGALPTRTIGLHADLTGPGRATGLAHRRGAELAVADHNSRTGQAFRLVLRTEDDAGEEAWALRVADQLVADPGVMAVLGPTGDVLSEDVVLRYGKGRLTTIVVAAGVTTADSHANLPLCVTRPYDRNLGPALVSYLVHSRPAGRILLVQDAADPERGWQLGSSFRDAALTGVTLTEHPLPEGESGFGAAARRATAVRADAVVYAGGSPSRAARLAAALAAEGFTGTRVGAGPALGPAFLRGAGRAADGWVFAEAYADAAALPSAAGFTAAHRRRFGAPPATWAAEAYDGIGLIARAAAATSAGGEGREGLAQRLVRTEHPGIVRTLAFSSSTRRVRYENGIFLYRVERGRPRFLGPYGEV